jgi:hypothetical protein
VKSNPNTAKKIYTDIENVYNQNTSNYNAATLATTSTSSQPKIKNPLINKTKGRPSNKRLKASLEKNKIRKKSHKNQLNQQNEARQQDKAMQDEAMQVEAMQDEVIYNEIMCNEIIQDEYNFPSPKTYKYLNLHHLPSLDEDELLESGIYFNFYTIVNASNNNY